MSDQDQSNAPKKPDFIAYNVKDSPDGKGYWNKVGAAWRHRDGGGYDIALDSMPVDGRITLREMREERMQAYEAQRQTRQPEQASEVTRSHGRER